MIINSEGIIFGERDVELHLLTNHDKNLWTPHLYE
jgi:hypothetical protein